MCPCLNRAPDPGRVQPWPPPATQLLDSSHINREKVEPSVGILFIFKNIAIICPGLGLAAGGGDVDTAACWKLHCEYARSAVLLNSCQYDVIHGSIKNYVNYVHMITIVIVYFRPIFTTMSS